MNLEFFIRCHHNIKLSDGESISSSLAHLGPTGSRGGQRGRGQDGGEETVSLWGGGGILWEAMVYGSEESSLPMDAALRLNTYLYGPKDDLKHRLLWREVYSPEEEESVAYSLSPVGPVERPVRFIRPLTCQDIVFSSSCDHNLLKRKLRQVARAFAILFDDRSSMYQADSEAFSSHSPTLRSAVTNDGSIGSWRNHPSSSFAQQNTMVLYCSRCILNPACRLLEDLPNNSNMDKN
ncbi:protein O-GlcNAcase [Lates japonicus]|uniref:Protein O-GlcNAcase n=1 Tax=Lates japonicus TaxID=270547 RepID=A0AAD3MFS3_LATJO|nr:protein O-GlcNAcase [Lates japonicus]